MEHIWKGEVRYSMRWLNNSRGISYRCHACGLATFARHGLVSIVKRVIPATGTKNVKENVKENIKGIINKNTPKKAHLSCQGGKHVTLSARCAISEICVWSCTCEEMKQHSYVYVVHVIVIYEHFAALPQLVYLQRRGFRPVNGLKTS
jgi:hypothetical protein